MRILLGALSCAGLVMAFPADAKDQSPNAANPSEKPVCKRIYDADLGSHFSSSKRVCHTALEWKEIEDGDARALQTLRDHAGISPPSAPGFGTPQ